MNEMLYGKELKERLTVLPLYDGNIRQKTAIERLTALEDIYYIYIANDMAVEIYSRLYLSIKRSIQKKNTIDAVKQHYENYKQINRQQSMGIIGGADSFSIIGKSGIGKSTAISRAITLISNNEIVEAEKGMVVPCVVVQTPNDCSIKGMLYEILRQIDIVIGSNYYDVAVHTRATTDMLIGSVSNIALNHIGLLIIDEIQNIKLSMKSKSTKNNGMNFIAMLVQLINSTGISMAFVGTPEVQSVFETEMHLARRTIGLQYDAMSYNQNFIDFCKTVFRYQYVRIPQDFSEGIAEWLYQHSGGVLSLVVGIIKDAQEIAILDGTEILDIVALEKAYGQRYQRIGIYTKREEVKISQKKKADTIIGVSKQKQFLEEKDFTIADIVKQSKQENSNIVDMLRQYIHVMEVAI